MRQNGVESGTVFRDVGRLLFESVDLTPQLVQVPMDRQSIVGAVFLFVPLDLAAKPLCRYVELPMVGTDMPRRRQYTEDGGDGRVGAA